MGLLYLGVQIWGLLRRKKWVSLDSAMRREGHAPPARDVTEEERKKIY